MVKLVRHPRLVVFAALAAEQNWQAEVLVLQRSLRERFAAVEYKPAAPQIGTDSIPAVASMQASSIAVVKEDRFVAEALR